MLFVSQWRVGCPLVQAQRRMECIPCPFYLSGNTRTRQSQHNGPSARTGRHPSQTPSTRWSCGRHPGGRPSLWDARESGRTGPLTALAALAGAPGLSSACIGRRRCGQSREFHTRYELPAVTEATGQVTPTMVQEESWGAWRVLGRPWWSHR